MSNRSFILIATPLGKGGQGGIDRMMDNLNASLQECDIANYSVQFISTRGKGRLIWSIFLMTRFVAILCYKKLKYKNGLVHINLATKGSTVRKMFIGKLCEFLKVPYLIHLHGAEYQDYWRETSNKNQKKIRKFFLNARFVLVLGSTWETFVAESIGVPTKRIIRLPNASNHFIQKTGRKNAGTMHIVFLGQIGSRKGTDDLFESLAMIPQNLKWCATIAGDGEVSKAITKCRELGIIKHIQFPGWINDKGVHKLLSNADILALPSYAENLPMAVIEGMAAGVAIVTTPVGAVPDIIENNITGILVAPGDTMAIKHAIEGLIKDNNLRIQMGRNAQQFHRQYLDLRVYGEKVLKIWSLSLL